MTSFLDKNGLDYYDDKLQTKLNNKVDKVSGKGLSTNDYTTTDKNKLDNIEDGAKVNVQSDWNVTDSNSDAYIKNKPTIPNEIIISEEEPTEDDWKLWMTPEATASKKIIADTLPVGSVVDYDGTEVPEGWVEVQEDSNIILLWQNPNYRTGFAPKYVTLNEEYSNFRFFFITYKGYMTNDGTLSTGIIPMGFSAWMQYSEGGSIHVQRSGAPDISNNKRFYFNGVSGTSTSNDFMVPVAVYAIR